MPAKIKVLSQKARKGERMIKGAGGSLSWKKDESVFSPARC